ncbi:MAG TPA: HAD-IIB family hydrolase [Opitutaceae bacterium]|nr:HAD-IIB family hydrolase [Opitutaceae bacterium]
MSRPGPIRLFCSDLDGTLTGPAPALPFVRAWRQIPLHRRPILVYSTGRQAEDARVWINASGLPRADYLISGVGTAIHDVAQRRELEEFSRRFGPRLDADAVRACVRAEPGILPQARRFNRRYKSAWHWPDAGKADLDRLQRRLEQAGLRAKVVFSLWRDLDVLPAGAGKGAALAWLCRRLRIPLDSVLVAGDSGNDAAMFSLPGVRTVAMPSSGPAPAEGHSSRSSFYRARSPGAPGVVEGLAAHGLITPGRPEAPVGRCFPLPPRRGR